MEKLIISKLSDEQISNMTSEMIKNLTIDNYRSLIYTTKINLIKIEYIPNNFINELSNFFITIFTKLSDEQIKYINFEKLEKKQIQTFLNQFNNINLLTNKQLIDIQEKKIFFNEQQLKNLLSEQISALFVRNLNINNLKYLNEQQIKGFTIEQLEKRNERGDNNIIKNIKKEKIKYFTNEQIKYIFDIKPFQLNIEQFEGLTSIQFNLIPINVIRNLEINYINNIMDEQLNKLTNLELILYLILILPDKKIKLFKNIENFNKTYIEKIDKLYLDKIITYIKKEQMQYFTNEQIQYIFNIKPFPLNIEQFKSLTSIQFNLLDRNILINLDDTFIKEITIEQLENITNFNIIFYLSGKKDILKPETIKIIMNYINIYGIILSFYNNKNKKFIDLDKTKKWKINDIYNKNFEKFINDNITYKNIFSNVYNINDKSNPFRLPFGKIHKFEYRKNIGNDSFLYYTINLLKNNNNNDFIYRYIIGDYYITENSEDEKSLLYNASDGGGPSRTYRDELAKELKLLIINNKINSIFSINDYNFLWIIITHLFLYNVNYTLNLKFSDIYRIKYINDEYIMNYIKINTTENELIDYIKDQKLNKEPIILLYNDLISYNTKDEKLKNIKIKIYDDIINKIQISEIKKNIYMHLCYLEHYEVEEINENIKIFLNQDYLTFNNNTFNIYMLCNNDYIDIEQINNYIDENIKFINIEIPLQNIIKELLQNFYATIEKYIKLNLNFNNDVMRIYNEFNNNKNDENKFNEIKIDFFKKFLTYATGGITFEKDINFNYDIYLHRRQNIDIDFNVHTCSTTIDISINTINNDNLLDFINGFISNIINSNSNTQNGGGNNYDKYIKYKKKYIYLKNKIYNK